MLTEHPRERLGYAFHLAVIKACVGIDWRVTRGEQKRVSLPEGNVQSICYMQQIVTAWSASSAFDETYLTLGDAGIERKSELTFAAAAPPCA